MIALFALLFAGTAFAADKGAFGSTCVQSHNKLAFGTHQLTTECNAAFFCADNGTCAHKGCRRDDFPFGYDVDDPLPPKCSKDQFCPDEADQCLPLLAVGQPCQLNRDDQCTTPDDKSLKGPRNNDGAICLNYQCMWSNATLSEKCIIENTPYVVYDQDGGNEYAVVVSRDNCKPGLYCDGSQLQCIQLKAIGADCSADKECDSYNCGLGGKCEMATSTTTHVATWVYAIIAVAIVGGMVGTLFLLFTFHRKNRVQELEKRSQYWREQESFRNNILAMREQARMSMLSLPRGLGHSTESSSPYAASKPSGLRGNPYSDEDGMEEPLVQHNQRGYDDDYSRDASRRRTRTEQSGNRF